MASFSSSTSRARLSLEELYKLVILIQAAIMIQEGSSKKFEKFPILHDCNATTIYRKSKQICSVWKSLK